MLVIKIFYCPDPNQQSCRTRRILFLKSRRKTHLFGDHSINLRLCNEPNITLKFTTMGLNIQFWKPEAAGSRKDDISGVVLTHIQKK